MKNSVFCLLLLSPILALAQHGDSIRVYYKCLNEISVSQLFSDFQPGGDILKIKGGRATQVDKNNKDRLALTPDSSVVVISVKKKNKPIKLVSLYSVNPPKPMPELIIDGKTYYSFSSLSGPMPGTIEVNLIADELFRLNSPRDAIYKIKKWDMTLKRGNQTLKLLPLGEKILPNEIASIRSLVHTGDVIQIRLLSVVRQNGLGEWTDQAVTRSSFVYAVTK